MYKLFPYVIFCETWWVQIYTCECDTSPFRPLRLSPVEPVRHYLTIQRKTKKFTLRNVLFTDGGNFSIYQGNKMWFLNNSFEYTKVSSFKYNLQPFWGSVVRWFGMTLCSQNFISLKWFYMFMLHNCNRGVFLGDHHSIPTQIRITYVIWSFPLN